MQLSACEYPSSNSVVSNLFFMGTYSADMEDLLHIIHFMYRHTLYNVI